MRIITNVLPYVFYNIVYEYQSTLPDNEASPHLARHDVRQHKDGRLTRYKIRGSLALVTEIDTT